MSRIPEVFKRKKKQVLSIYFTAGFPRLNDTIFILKALENSGADMVELGMPYSDPLADGEVIQASSSKALSNGMTISLLFEQLKDLRKSISMPIILMGYMNPVLQYGFEKFCVKAKELGIDGVIIPDLPMYEYESEYGPVLKKNGLDFIFLVTPETSDERVKKLDALSSGFLYAVSSSSTTGKDKNMSDQTRYFQKLQQMQLKNPLMVGFGIKDRTTFETSCQFANGGIIGTAFIRAIADAPDVENATKNFINSIKKDQ